MFAFVYQFDHFLQQNVMRYWINYSLHSNTQLSHISYKLSEHPIQCMRPKSLTFKVVQMTEQKPCKERKKKHDFPEDLSRSKLQAFNCGHVLYYSTITQLADQIVLFQIAMPQPMVHQFPFFTISWNNCPFSVCNEKPTTTGLTTFRSLKLTTQNNY